MAKKCIICKEEARYIIKDTSDYYCEECAKDSFNDISALLKVEEQAQMLKKAIKEKMKEEQNNEETTEKTSDQAEEKETSEEVSEEKKITKKE